MHPPWVKKRRRRKQFRYDSNDFGFPCACVSNTKIAQNALKASEFSKCWSWTLSLKVSESSKCWSWTLSLKVSESSKCWSWTPSLKVSESSKWWNCTITKSVRKQRSQKHQNSPACTFWKGSESSKCWSWILSLKMSGSSKWWNCTITKSNQVFKMLRLDTRIIIVSNFDILNTLTLLLLFKF